MSGLPYTPIEDMQAFARSKMQRAPDFVIGDPERPYLRRWWIVPRNEWCNVYLHEILRSDDDRALHDHPWANTSFVIEGGYTEVTPEGQVTRVAGDVVSRRAEALHRLVLPHDWRAITLFITGPKVREWGFDCPKGWRHWREFTGGERGELVGRGCGE